MAKSYAKAKGRRASGAFVALPVDVMNSSAYLSLSSHAAKLFLSMLRMIRIGKRGGPCNNGDLSIPFEEMRKTYGFKSKDTLNKAKNELLDKGLIGETRTGGFPARCSLYGVTFFSCDECDGKLDIQPRHFPYGAWQQWKPGSAPVSGTRLNTPAVPKGASTGTTGVPSSKTTSATGTAGVSVGHVLAAS